LRGVVIRALGLYHVPVHDLAQKVLEHIRRDELLKPGDRLGVAVSGGADSVGLLRLLLELRKELGVVLSVVHFNHKLREGESDADEQFVAALARQHKLEFHSKSTDVAAHASAERLSIETAARELRYEFFAELLGGGSSSSGHNRGKDKSSDRAPMRLDKIATGHTLDDQAETVLMRVLRGTGVGGLGGIYPRLVVEDGEQDSVGGEIIRPLLSLRRQELEEYLTAIGQPWRDDATNMDLQYTRNRVRHTLLPLIEREFNPGIMSSLSDLAEIARAEEDYWESEASGWMGTTVQWFSPDNGPDSSATELVQLLPAGQNALPTRTEDSHDFGAQPMNAAIDLMWLLAESTAVQRRLIKSIGEEAEFPLEFKHVEEILRFAAGGTNTGKQLALPLGWRVVREPDSLVFLSPNNTVEDETTNDYGYRLAVPGEVLILELGTRIQALRTVPGDLPASYNPEHLFEPALFSKELMVRNWRPGDRFRPAHTKSPKKIKELLQERHVTGRERKLWPVVARGDEIVWVRGFAAPDQYRSRVGEEAILIRELPIDR
jgi:tRNA(Ile)-lysidine synthase